MAEERSHLRYRVNAQAIWAVDGVEVRWPVWTLSWGGAGLVARPGVPAVGARLRVRFAQPGRDLGCAEVEIAYTTDKRVGLRFLEIDVALRGALADLFAKLTPIA